MARVSSSISRVFFICSALSLVAPGISGATGLHGGSQSIMTWGQEDTDEEILNVIPLYEFLNASVSDVGVKGLSLELSGWGMLDFADVHENTRGEGDVNYFFLRYQGLGNDLDLKLGRHFLFLGSGYGALLDGATASYRLPLGFKVEGFGGATVVPHFAGRENFWSAGWRFSNRAKSFLGTTELGVSYLQQRESGRQARENYGIDAVLSPCWWLDVSGSAAYDNIAYDFADVNVAASVRAVRGLKVTADFERTLPSLFIPKTSIFSVFALDRHDSVGGDAEYRIFENLSAGISYRFLRFSASEAESSMGHKDTARVAYHFGSGLESVAGLEGIRLKEYENGFNGARLFMLFKPAGLLEWNVFASTDFEYYKYDEEMNGYDASYNVRATAGYDLTKDVSVLASVDGSMNPLLKKEWIGFLKAAYNFNADFAK